MKYPHSVPTSQECMKEAYFKSFIGAGGSKSTSKGGTCKRCSTGPLAFLIKAPVGI